MQKHRVREYKRTKCFRERISGICKSVLLFAIVSRNPDAGGENGKRLVILVVIFVLSFSKAFGLEF